VRSSACALIVLSRARAVVPGGVVDEPARAGGEQPQHLLELGRIDPHPADLRQVAGEDRLDVGAEVARALARAARQRVWKASATRSRRGRAALRRTAHLRRAPVEQRVDHRAALASISARESGQSSRTQLCLGERRDDSAVSRSGRSGEQELTGRRILVEDLLDGEHQARRALDLVDHRRTRQRQREPVGSARAAGVVASSSR